MKYRTWQWNGLLFDSGLSFASCTKVEVFNLVFGRFTVIQGVLEKEPEEKLLSNKLHSAPTLFPPLRFGLLVNFYHLISRGLRNYMNIGLNPLLQPYMYVHFPFLIFSVIQCFKRAIAQDKTMSSAYMNNWWNILISSFHHLSVTIIV